MKFPVSFDIEAGTLEDDDGKSLSGRDMVELVRRANSFSELLAALKAAQLMFEPHNEYGEQQDAHFTRVIAACESPGSSDGQH